jgi:hypothetical protein
VLIDTVGAIPLRNPLSGCYLASFASEASLCSSCLVTFIDRPALFSFLAFFNVIGLFGLGWSKITVHFSLELYIYHVNGCEFPVL